MSSSLQQHQQPGSRYDRRAALVWQLLYHNLGGEMMYILSQRMVAQKIARDKADQVLTDVISNFVSSRSYWLRTFMSNSDRCINSQVLKSPFESIISSSPIMKLTPSSYDKLYDLMIAVFKYQLSLAPFPSSLYFISLNHVNSLLDTASEIGDGIRLVVKGMQESFVEAFSHLSKQQWSLLRNIILSNFLLDIRTRVSILVREKKQDMETGFFVITPPVGPECMFNGRITHFDEKGNVIQEEGIFSEGSSEMTTLGLDIYRSDLSPRRGSLAAAGAGEQGPSETCAGQEAKLLLQLLGGKQGTKSPVLLDFEFDDDDDDEPGWTDVDLSGQGDKRSDQSSDQAKRSLLSPDQTVTLPRTLVRADKFDVGSEAESDSRTIDGDELLALMDS